MERKNRIWCSVLTIFAAIILSIAVIVVVVVVVSNGAQQVSYKLHVNPADPVILSAETPDGDIIYMFGSKTAAGIPQSIDEFQVENEQGSSTYISMNDDGKIGSAQDSDGLQIDFDWDENRTTVHISIVVNNGSQQLTINVNLSEPVGKNFTDFSDEPETDRNFPAKRSLNEFRYPFENIKTQSSRRQTRQTDSQDFASVFVTVESCSQPEPNARVFADIVLDDRSATKYWGSKSSTPGKYEVRIPTSSASTIGEKTGKLCDKIEMLLGKVCDFYSKANKLTKLVSGYSVDSVFCFFLGKGLRLAFPPLRLLPVNRFCKNIFKPLKWYCNKANKDIKFTDKSPVDLFCAILPRVDNGIDFFQQKDISFTPTAIFPQGNQVRADGELITIQPGMSNVPTRFTIVNDQAQLRITRFGVYPFDPVPRQRYLVVVTYECFSSSSFFVRMSIVGTDGYQGSNVCYTGPTCTLNVPGAEALVRDDILVDIQNSNTAISRRVIVIF